MAQSTEDQVEINFKNLPPQLGFKINWDKLKGFELHPEGADAYAGSEGEPGLDKTTRVLGTNDFHLSYLEGQTGAAIPWHTHTPIMDQCYIPIEGKTRVNFKDNEGKVHSTEGELGDVIYLPAGAHNKIDVVEGPLKMLVIERETLVPRVENLVGDNEGVYGREDVEYGLEIDGMRGRVIRKADYAVEEY